MKHHTALRSLLIATTFPLMLVGCPSTPTTPSEPESYEMAMENMKKACPSCEATLDVMLKAMNRQCDFPLTKDNAKSVASSHPAYAFALAANSMLAGNKNTKQAFNNAFINNLNCWNADAWITSTKEAMAESEQFQSILTSAHE